MTTDFRHEPLAGLDALMCLSRYGEGGLRLGIGTGHEVRAGQRMKCSLTATHWHIQA